MSIAALNQTYQEARRLSIAGSDLARGDFRLERLVEPLRQSAAKAPVFGRVADQIDKLLSSDSKGSAPALLELTSLVAAILYTQGETGAQGPLEPIESTDMGVIASDTSARVLKPLIEALTTTGSGRLEIVQSAHQREGFNDIRLIKHVLHALDDAYAELADFVANQVLPTYGKAIYPELLARFDPKGRGGAARRLRLMHKLDPARTRSLVDQALDEGSKEVRLDAIRCLQGREDAVDFLLEQAQARAQEVRHEALSALSTIDEPRVIARLVEALSGKEAHVVARGVAANPSPELAAHVLEQVRAEIRLALDPPKKTKASAPAKASANAKSPDQGARFATLLLALLGRKDEASVGVLLECLEARDALAALKDSNVGERSVGMVGRLLLATDAARAVAALAELGPDAMPTLADSALRACTRAHGPGRAYEIFIAPFADRPAGKSKAAQVARERASALVHALRQIAAPPARRRGADPAPASPSDPQEALDPRWLDAAIAAGDLELVIALERPGHAGLQTYYTQWIEARLAEQRWTGLHLQDAVLFSMVRTQHPQLVPLAVRVFERVLTDKSVGHYWGHYYLFRVIPSMPSDAAEPLLALVPRATAQGLVDYFVTALDELRQKGRT